MKTNAPQMIFPFIYSLMLHTVFIAILLLLSPPLYRISGDFQFVDVRLYSSFLFRDNNKPINKALQKSAASNKTKTRQDISRKSSAEKKEIPENKKAPEKVEGHDIAQQLEQFAKEQKESEEPIASVMEDAIKEDRKNELSQDIDSAGLKSSAEELKQKEEPPAEPKVDVKEESEPKSEGPIKTARIQQNDAPMTEKAVDSLFDNEGIYNKEVETFKEKAEEIHSQPYASLQNKKAEIKIEVKENPNPAIIWPKQVNSSFPDLIGESIHLDSRLQTAGMTDITAGFKEKETRVANLPSLAAPSQSAAHEIEGSAIDKIFEVQEKETLADLPETKELILFEPYGDLKFEIKIEEGLINNLKTTITYREFLKKQRNRPLKRSEVKYIRVEPKIINRGNSIMTVIVETAGEGVYKFMIESDNKPLKVSIAVKFYEKSAKEKSKTLGPLTVNDKTLAAKILMPEGILWDDNSYFSGYMEDSESITKFNTGTGLVWKEYKE